MANMCREIWDMFMEPKNTFSVVLQVFTLAVFWWSAAVVVAIGMKRQLGPFPFPFALTGVVNFAVAFMSWPLALCWKSATTKHSNPAGNKKDISTYGILVLIGFGACQGVELALGSKALSMLSISTNRMAMACCVVFQLATSVLWGIEKFGPTKMVAVVLLVGGGMLEGAKCERPTGLLALVCGPHPRTGGVENPDMVGGWILVFVSVILSSNRWALTQYVLQKSSSMAAVRDMTKLQLLPYMAPATSGVCFAIAAAFEQEAFKMLIVGMRSMAFSLIVISVSILTLTICELRIVHITAATVMVVLSAVHNIPMLLAGVIVNHDDVFRNQWLGFILCTTGAIVYFTARLGDEAVSENDQLVSRSASDSDPLLQQRHGWHKPV